MIAKLTRTIFLLTLIISVSTTSLAQSTPATPVAGETRSPGGPRRQLATILFAGLGGAVLGLSTLSFYGRPQDNLRNIAIGFAGGVIFGTAFVTYRAATSPSEFYGTRPQIEDEVQFTNRAQAQTAPLRAPTFAMTFEF